MNSVYFQKIIKPGDILKGEQKFIIMFYEVKNDALNGVINPDRIDTIVNYGILLLKQMGTSNISRVYRRKMIMIQESIQTLEEIKHI